MTTVPDPECGCQKIIENETGEQIALIHRMPPALVHYYPLPALGSRVIPLFRGKFDSADKRHRGTVSVNLDPRPSIDVTGVKDVTVEDLLSLAGSRGSAKWVERPSVQIRSRGVPTPPKTARMYWRRKPGTQRISLDPQPIEIGEPDGVDEVTFFLINGWRASDGLNTCYEGHDQQGRLQVQLGDWELRIEPRGDQPSNALRDHMRSTARSTVTHVGRLRRADLADFTALDAVNVLDIVETLVSFALGRVTSILLPVGWKGGEAVWTRWSALRAVDRPLGTAPWLDEHVATTQLAELMARGFTLSQDALKWEVFQRALGYYFSSNFEATVTMKVMLPVSALQMLSFAQFVEVLPETDHGHLSKTEWGDLTTENAVRKLLDRVDARVTIPGHLTHLTSVQAVLAATAPTPDGLRCVIKMRNDVAHPERSRLARWNTYQWAEAGFLAMEQFDLALLWWLGYEGRYMPRTAHRRSHDDSVLVPWATSSS